MSTAGQKVATYIKRLQDFADGALYRMQPAHEGHEYVAVSAVNNEWAHETYIFPASENGEVTNWGELDGSLRNTTEHADALRDAGYSIASVES